jgi:hypothetical protein
VNLIQFHTFYPELAERETCTLTTFGQDGLPADTYGLVESYCGDPDCDCQRVMLNVVSKKHPERGYLASICHGFDREDEMAGPFLDPLNPQSELAEALLEHVQFVLLDEDYIARLQRHYAMFKEVVADPTHPAHRRIAERQAERARAAPVRPTRRIERNPAACWCGSGKKYKHCHWRQDRRTR